jgi:hypothetical protein
MVLVEEGRARAEQRAGEWLRNDAGVPAEVDAPPVLPATEIIQVAGEDRGHAGGLERRRNLVNSEDGAQK